MLISKGISNLFKVLILLGISLLFLTCDPGLGKAVDTQAPTVAVEFPVTKSVLKGGFVMKGIATDEVKVSDCFVTFKNMATSLEYNFSATVSNGEFTASINTPKEDGTFELPDGDYNVTVTVSDAYRNSTVDVVYTIDNTAPTVLLTSPNSYSVSNWPNMYKTFSIKGEVYDRSNLESVTVFLVDEAGEVLKSVIADGTNTFLASFDTPFDEEKTCYYYAVAKDAGGNENTYCYHKSDIFQLLSISKNNQTLESDTSVVFPSINTIGYVDQGQTTNLTEMLSRADLVAKKIENNGAKKVDGKIVFPGFNYFKDNAAQIKWLNISNDVSKVAGIAIGSPVLGTIMPPTDGSAINYSTVRVWVAKVPADFKAEDEHNTPEDFKKYLNENLFTSENELETCVISEGEKGDKQVKLTAVGESLNFQVDCNKPGNDESYWPSGFYYVKVEFTTESGVTSYDFCKFEVTSGAPVLTEGNFSKGNEKASYYRGYVTSNSIQEGFAGKALTSDENSPVEIDWSYIGTTVAGEEVKSEVTRIQPAIDGAYTIDINHEQDGEYTYTLTAAPDSELSTVISRVVVVDTTKPVITYSTLVEGEIKESTEISVKGNVDDANGIEKVEYQLYSGTSQVLIDGSECSGWQEIAKAKSSFNLTLTNLKESVDYTIKIRATDVAGNVSEESSCRFTIDLSNPVGIIEEPKPEENSSIVFVKEIPEFKGKASDAAVTEGKKAKSAELTYTKDGGSVVKVSSGSGEGEFNWNQEAGTWTWKPTSRQFNGTGKYDVTLKVTDDSGKTTSVSRTVSMDTIVPSIKLTQVSSYVERSDAEGEYYVNGEITVKFDITENDYIKEIKWYKPDGSVDSQELGTNAQPTVKISTTDFADGTKLGAFKLEVTDRSGNQGVYSGAELIKYEINQVSDKPTIDVTPFDESITTAEGITASHNLYSTGDVLTITLKDDDGVAEGTYQVDEKEIKISGGNAKVKTETISLQDLAQGPHTIKYSVKDINGKEVSKGIFSFGIDDKVPELKIDGYTDNDIEAGFKNGNFEITGTVSDTYELKDLVYNYTDLNEDPTIIRNANGNWTISIEKPGTSQKKTIKFVATDKFLRTTVKTFTYAFDLDKPNLIVSNSSGVNGKIFNQINSFIEILGTSNDMSGSAETSSGIKYVQYGIGVGHNAVEPQSWELVSGTSSWNKTITIPDYSDGPYTLFVKAIDNSENESDVQKFNITADSTSPVLTEGDSTDANSTRYSQSTLNLTGTVTDDNLNELYYTYSFGENSVTEKPSISGDSNWVINKSDLADGTHIFKIVATDKAGNSSVITRNIIVDNTDPVITTNVSPQIMYNDGTGEKLTVNGTIDVNVRVTETNKLKGVYYTENTTLADDTEWSGVTGVTSFNETELSTGKTISVDTTRFADKSTLPLRIKAVDEAGNYSVVYVNPVINQESDKPSLTPSNFVELKDENDENEKLAGWLGGNPTNVFSSSNPNMIFTLSDDDSVKEYSVKVVSGDFVKISEVNSTQKIVTYSLEDLIKNGNYGRHTITFRVKDVNCAENLSSTQNNFVDKTYYIAIDDGAPILTLDNANGQFVGSSFAIKGNVKDANGIDKISLSSVGGSGFATKELTLGNGLSENGDFSYAFTETSTKSDINIAVIDRIGNTSYGTLTYKLDGTKPIVNIANGVNAFVDGDSPTLRITGSAVDGDLGSNDNGISGIDQVRLKIGSQITGVNDEDSVLASGKIEDGVMSWSYNLDFTGKAAGSYPVYVQAFDIAGNVSDEQNITVYVDTDVPQLSHAYADNFVGVYNGNFVIEGTASDASGVKSITAKIQGASGNLTGTFTATSNNSPAGWSFNIPANTGDGQLTILVTAKDGCGKSVQETFTATLDTEVPSVTFTDISDDDANNTTIETSKTTDKPRVSVTYADSTSGVKNIDYTFYYYDAEQDKFVDYSSTDGNAKGAFTRDKSFSGTVVMRMAETTGSTGAFIGSDTETDGKWYVKVTITDEAGNSKEYDSPYFYVDQHKPSLEVSSPTDLSLKKQNDSLSVNGTTSDSFGGEVDKVVVKITHPNYSPSDLETFTKTFTKDGSNGTKLLTKIGNDETYSFEYTWDEANSPFKFANEYEISILTYDKAGNETPVTRKVSCDSTAPTISFSRPYSYSVDAYGNETKGSVVNSPIGDTNIKALANDYSMDSIYYQLGGTVEIKETGTKGQSTYKITKLTISDGGVGNDSYGNSITDPSSDNLASGVLIGTWNKLTSANLDFDVEYNTLNMVNSGKTYHVAGDKDTIQTLDVHVVAVDTAGNINYCKYPLKVDTDTDKPALLMLSPKTINDVANVGGTATISGTVNDDNAVHSVWMQVELVNGNYSGNILSGFSPVAYNVANQQALEETTDGSGKTVYSVVADNEYFKDKSKWYRVNIGAENATSTTWNMMLNKDGEFDIAKLKEAGCLPNDSSLEQTELKVRVKALDTKSGNSTVSDNAKIGDVTEFTLKIDSGSPSIIINNIEDFPNEGSYIGGNITFDLEFSDDQSITEWKVEAISTASGDNRSMIIASGQYSVSYDDGLGKTVKPSADGKYVGSNGIITVDTADIYAQCGNLIQFKISAKDNSKDPQSQTESPKESYITFKYTIDNSAPEASLVATIDSKSYYIDTESSSGDSNRETDIRDNHLRIMSDEAAFKGKVIDESNGSGIDYVMLYFTKGNRLYNPGAVDSSSVISTYLSVKDKDGNTVSPLSPVESLKDVVRTSGKSNPYIVIDSAEGMADTGANGDLDGYDENLKANGDWVVYIKSSNLPDGVYTIHYLVVDHAGNARYYSDSMLVQNKAPTITSIVLATDIDGDGTADVTFDGSGDEDQAFDSLRVKNPETNEYEPLSTGFIVRNNKLKINVNVDGGTKPLKYFLKYRNSSGNEVTTDKTNEGYSSGIFTVTDFPQDGNASYVVWVEDSVEENLSLSSGETTINMIIDNEDDVKPVAQLFELNTIVEDSIASNENRGSLFKDSDGKLQGHIDLRKNSLNEDSENDPDVSGKIILRGEALDNQRIKSIVLKLNEKTEKTVTIAEWNSTINILEAKNGATINDSIGLSGHYVEWAYVWDTNSFAKEDVDVSVIVNDATSNTNVESEYSSIDNNPRGEDDLFILDNWGYNKMTVDVVPYITALNTTLTALEKRNPSVYGRSALGKYPVYYYRKTTSESEQSEVITMEGFNIRSGVEITFAGGSTTRLSSDLSFSLPEGAKSGEIYVTVDDVTSLNNKNNNEAIGSSGELYNRQPNGQNNDLLTDNVELAIWEINSKAAIAKSGELSEVVMHVNPTNGMLGFAFAHSQDLASYPTAANTTLSHVYKEGSSWKRTDDYYSKTDPLSYHTWMTDWTAVNQIGFVYDQDGNVFGTNGGTDTYTPNYKAGRLGLISSHWGTITDNSVNNDNYTGYTKFRRLRLEYLGITQNGAYASNVFRFAKGDCTQLTTTKSGDYTNLYMMYYDNTLGQLKFKAGAYNNNWTYGSKSDNNVNLEGTGFSKAGFSFGDFADDACNEADGNGKNYSPNYQTISIVANQSGANGNASVRPGIYYSISAVQTSSGDVVVAVWYDDENKTLWYSYLKNPLDNAGNRNSDGAISTEWETPIKILDGHAGGYCAIKADDEGNIHIAAYSRNDAGSLYYAYLDNYDSEFDASKNLVAVDSYGSQGQYITMEVAKDEEGNNIPYIGYYMNSMSYPKYAYLVDTDLSNGVKPGVDSYSAYTGAWESIILPTTSSIVLDDINIGVWKNDDGILKAIPTQSESAGEISGIAGGNGTSNPVFAYGIAKTGSGYIETAQLK